MAFQWDKYLYSLYIFGTNLSFGILFAFFPSIMVDMKFIMSTTMTLISLHPVLETVGYTMGTFVGLTYRWLNRQLVMALSFIAICVVSAITPLLSHLWLLYIFAFVFGFGSSINISGYIVWTIEQWKDKSPPLLQIYTLAFSLGSVICTSILGPYLTGEVRVPVSNETDHGENLVNVSVAEVSVGERRDKLVIPSIIMCLVLCSAPFLSLILYFIMPYKMTDIKQGDDLKAGEIDETQEVASKLFDNQTIDRKIRIMVKLLLALWFTLYVLSETMFFKFAIAYYQYCPHQLSAEDAAKLFTYSIISYSVTRVFNVLISVKVTINTILNFHYVILVIGMLLMIGAHWDYTTLWVSGPVLMAGFAPMFAGSYAFAARYVTMTDQLSTVFLFSRGVFTLFTPSLIGQFIENYSFVFIIVNVVYIVSSLVLYLVIYYFIIKFQKLLKCC